MAFYITTTGAVSSITFDDLGGRTFSHPTVNYDLELEYDIDILRQSDSLYAALNNGYITALNEDGELVTATNIENTTTLSATEIKQLYESNADTNAYTNDEQTKVAVITTTGDGTKYLADDGLYKTVTSGGGDMLKTTYDSNNNGIVDNSERLGGQLASYYTVTTNITEGTNLYFTTTRARQSISGTTNVIDYNSSTGVITIASTYVGQTSIITLGTITTGTWNGSTIGIAYGGTGQITALAAFNALSPLTTKGDILTRNTTDNIRLPIGTDGYVLKADSTQASGLAWELLVFGDSYSTQSNSTPATTTSSSGYTTNNLTVVAHSYTLNAANAGQYRLNVKFNYTGNSTLQSVKFRWYIDGVVQTLPTVIELKDTTDDLTWVNFIVTNLTAGNHTLQLRYATEGGNSATVSYSEIEFWRVS